MAEVANAAAAAPAADGEQQQGPAGWVSTALRWFMMYYAIQTFMGKWKGGNDTPPANVDSDGHPIPVSTSQLPHTPLWKENSRYNIKVYASEEADLFSILHSDHADDDLLYTQSNIEYSCNDGSFSETDMNFTLTPSLKNNGSFYAHVILWQMGYPIDETDDGYDNTKVLYRTHPLVSYRAKPKKKKENLLFKKNQDTEKLDKDADDDDVGDDERAIINYWKPELTIRPLCDWSVFKANTIPIQIADHYNIDVASNRYWPVLYMDDFWLLSDKLIALNNASLLEVPLKIALSPIAQWKFMLQIQMEAQYAQQSQYGLSNTEDNDEVRRLLMESNPILLAVTMVVTLFHTLFDFLAFKNDIQFWRKTESMKGLSVKTIFVNCVCQLIIFLYLLDQDTTWMILISSGVGFLIECWKITQAGTVTYGLALGFPFVHFEDKATYTQSDTKKYDEEAYRYMSWVFYPLMVGYSAYSLVYNEHKGWYSFVVGSAVSFIYMFGFIMMCPQLYLNYKLKSTAFMPWRMMTYKFLNTIIDDLFAFLIKMPTMHRLSCFRDDIIFLIFLYQKWIYRTDYSRYNEYGFKAKEAIESDEKDNQDDDEKDKNNAIENTATETEENETETQTNKESEENVTDELDSEIDEIDPQIKKNN